MPETPNSAASSSTGSSPELELIQEAKNQIRILVQEITQLSQSDLEVSEFYDQFLPRVVSAMASAAGAVWSVDEDGQIRLLYQVNLAGTKLTDSSDGEARHRLLLRKIVTEGQPAVIPPQSGSQEPGEPGNPTDLLLVVVPARVDHRPELLLEIFQRAGGGPTTHRGYLRFVMQMADLAGNFLRHRRLRHLGDQQSLWEKLEQFLAAVHRRLDSLSVAYTIANDGRLLCGCDRLSVLTTSPRGWQLRAVSGLETIDRRATEVVTLERLATLVANIKRAVCYTGNTEDLPPQIATELQRNLDESHAKFVAIVPMTATLAEDTAPSSSPESPRGILVAEQFQQTPSDTLLERLEFLAEHGGMALQNAQLHESIFLLPVWRALGARPVIQRFRSWSRWGLAVLVASVALAVLSCFPVDFSVPATGRLQPVERHEVFAQVDGVVKEVRVRHEQMVQAGELLVRMSNNSLEAEISSLEGKLRSTQERIAALQHEQLQQRVSADQLNQISCELLELAQVEHSAQRMLEIYRQKQQSLDVRSENAGQVVTWRVEEILEQRPVSRGQSLMTLVNPDGAWELELNVPERRMGHLARATRQADGGLAVTFALASFPGRSFSGRLQSIHGRAHDEEGESGAVLARASVIADELPERRSGTTVTARVHCGRRPLGFVVLCDLIETVHTKVLFWLL